MYKLETDGLHPYTLVHRTSYKSVPSSHGLFLQFLHKCKFVWSEVTYEEFCGRTLDTAVWCDNCLKYFSGNALNSVQFFAMFLVKENFVFAFTCNLFTILCTVDFKGIATLGIHILNFLCHFDMISSLHRFAQ
jgi:hypothetical protein